jgi:putative transposase
MDGCGRALDHVLMARLWHTVKYEEMYLKDDGTPREAMQGFEQFLQTFNKLRPHQALGYQPPATVYFGPYV